MTSDELSAWIENNLSMEYDDLSDTDGLVDKWIKRAKEISEKKDEERWRSFQAAVKGGYGDDYITPVKNLRNDIEDSDLPEELPDVDEVSEFFKKPLKTGLEKKKQEINERWEEELSGEIEVADSDSEVDEVIDQGREIKLDNNVIEVLETRGDERKGLIKETPIREELIEADSVEDIAAIEIPDDLSAQSKRRLKQFKGLREAEEKVEDFVGPTKDKWNISQQLVAEMIDSIDMATTGDELLSIDPTLLPTKSGQKRVRDAINRRIQELTSE